jgi:imidazolonepropionase-like amidohydrolase
VHADANEIDANALNPANGPVWLHVGTMLDGTSTIAARDVHVVFDNASILFVGRDGRVPPREFLSSGQDRPDVEAPAHTLLPGLTEAHAHLFLLGGELDAGERDVHRRRPAAELLASARDRMAALVRLGVIAVRDAGDRDGVGLALSKLYASDVRPFMPYVESPGAAIHRRGRYGGFMGGALEDYPTLHDCVKARVESGADRIKLIATGVIDFKSGQMSAEPQLSAAEIKELVAAARSFGLQTFAHASGDAGIDEVIDGGVDSIEHGFFMRDDQLARMRDRRIAWVPTFAPVRAQLDNAATLELDSQTVANLRRILDAHAASVARAHELGVLLVAGSDAGSPGVTHGHGLFHELELMERAGMPPAAVINSATGTGAMRLGYKEKFGRIEAGYLSRFILTRHSPLETVANLRKPRIIVFNGEAFEQGRG